MLPEDPLVQKKPLFDNSFLIRSVTAEFNLPYEIPRSHICEARERHNAHADTQKLTIEKETMTAFIV